MASQASPLNSSPGLEEKEKGNAEFKAGRYGPAFRHYSNAIKLESGNAVYYSNRCACLLKMNKDSRALVDAGKCIELDEKWPKGYFRRAESLFGLRRHDEALSALHKAILLSSDDGKKVPREMLSKLKLILERVDLAERSHSMPLIVNEKGEFQYQNDEVTKYLNEMGLGNPSDFSEEKAKKFAEGLWLSSISRLLAGDQVPPSLYFLTRFIDLTNIPLENTPQFLSILIAKLQLHALAVVIHRSDYRFNLVDCTPALRVSKIVNPSNKHSLPPSDFAFLPSVLHQTPEFWKKLEEEATQQ